MVEVLLLDTNIVSYIMRKDSRADAYLRHFVGKTLAITFMTVAELYEGAYRKEWDAGKLSRLEEELRKYIVIPSSENLCRAWGEIRSRRKRQLIAVDDAWIAAAAVAHGCTLVTHNSNDFLGISNLKLLTEQTA